MAEDVLDGLPPLTEHVAVDPALINGVDPALLRGDGKTPFTITFLSSVAEQDNILGYYIVQDVDSPGEAGVITDVHLLFPSVKDTTPGEAVQIGALEEDQTLGLFLIADGADLNNNFGTTLYFFDHQGFHHFAAVDDPVPDLFGFQPGPEQDFYFHIAGQVLHASDFVEGDQGNVLNPGGLVRTLSGQAEDGSLLVAFEDRTERSDRDFNDAIVRIEGPGLGTGGSIELADIVAGEGGFALNGVAEGDRSGLSVSGAGDVNGDGLDDLIVGAFSADPNKRDFSGQSYVVFGKADGSLVELADIADGQGGFALNGVNAEDSSGRSVSGAGDVNGDGLDDLIVGALYADPNGDRSGQSYVVFGKADGSTVELSDIVAGEGGFALNGIAEDDHSGISVSGAGDVNGDGLDDLIVGAFRADPNGNYSGQSYVVFGKADGSAVELADIVAGQGGFTLNGAAEGDFSGASVSGAGDVNGDGLDDLIVGAFDANPNGNDSGQSYVVFGKADGSPVELSDIVAGEGGFALNGVNEYDGSGYSVSGAGDVNGDGLDDLIVGASRALTNAGQSYVVLGKADGNIVELSDIVAGEGGGFALNGVNADDFSGVVSGAGDVDGDGLDDLIIGAGGAGPNGNYSGQSYVVFGGDLLA